MKVGVHRVAIAAPNDVSELTRLIEPGHAPIAAIVEVERPA